ncbi:MAG: DUF1295 domain-containing protein [Pseudomonadota bacterium]
MKYVTFLFPFGAALAVLLASETLASAAALNALAQAILFLLVVCIPLYRTGLMSYVDIGWPTGIILIGLTAATLDGFAPRVLAVGLVYAVIGARMGMMALGHWLRGELRTELPRYAYQRRRWKKAGKTHTMLAAQSEVIAQGAFNASFLAIPAFIIAANPTPSWAPLEYLGLAIWAAAFVFETIADRQKKQFIRTQQAAGVRDGVCDVGLWAYSRHPNYFGQWMGWNGVLIAAVPSWWALYAVEPIVLWLALAVGALLVSYFMYNTLVYYSGAVPSEYYSVRKRPGFAAYQARTPRFFPRRPNATPP